MTKEQKAEKSIQDEYRRTFDALQTAVCGRTLDQRTLMLMRLSFRLGSLYKILEQIWFRGEDEDE